MFSLLTDKMVQDVNMIRSVLRTHEAIRSRVFAAGHTAPDPWDDIRALAPVKPDWHIFDHCAAITRLYASFEQFVAEIVSEFLRIAPELYPVYSDLPEAVRTQHRVAVGVLLQKWSVDGPYKMLSEKSILKGLSAGVLAGPSYSLLSDAFLIDPQNYRADAIKKIFGYLGLSNCWASIEEHKSLKVFIRDHRDATETVQTILHDLVECRNEAAHNRTSEVLSVDEILSYATFLLLLCEALTNVLKEAVLKRRVVLKHVTNVGTIVRNFGRAVGIKMEIGFIETGEELILGQNADLTWGNVVSIREGIIPRFLRFDALVPQELGLVFNCRAQVGDVIYRLSIP